MDAVLGWNLVLSLPVILAIAWLAGRLLGVSRSLFQFFGYFGLFCATVLILRVIVAILHDGLN
jgi:hypothetical protein